MVPQPSLCLAFLGLVARLLVAEDRERGLWLSLLHQMVQISVYMNTHESFFALLMRGHYGTFDWFSRKHTHRYCDEFGFRWDHRKVSYGERMVAAIKGAEGKRLVCECLTVAGSQVKRENDDGKTDQKTRP